MTSDVDRFYRTLAREAADAIIYADVNGITTFWNKGAERVFGFSEQEAIGGTGIAKGW
jgi:PAS domain S-box-containing protein